VLAPGLEESLLFNVSCLMNNMSKRDWFARISLMKFNEEHVQYRALLIEYEVLFEYTALLIKYRALLIAYRAFLTEYVALLMDSRALLSGGA